MCSVCSGPPGCPPELCNLCHRVLCRRSGCWDYVNLMKEDEWVAGSSYLGHRVCKFCKAERVLTERERES